MNGRPDVLHDPHSRIRGERLLLVERVAQCLLADVFEQQVGKPVTVVKLDEPHDAGVLKAGERRAFVAQHTTPFAITRVFRSQAFADERRSQDVMPDGENVGAHAARDAVGDGEIVDARAGRNGIERVVIIHESEDTKSGRAKKERANISFSERRTLSFFLRVRFDDEKGSERKLFSDKNLNFVAKRIFVGRVARLIYALPG